MWFVVYISIPVLLEGLSGKLHIFNTIPPFFELLQKLSLYQLHLLVFKGELVTCLWILLVRKETFWTYILLQNLGFYFLLFIVTSSSLLRADTRLNQIFYFSSKWIFSVSRPLFALGDSILYCLYHFCGLKSFWKTSGNQICWSALTVCCWPCWGVAAFILLKWAKFFTRLLKLTLSNTIICMWKYLVGIIALRCSGDAFKDPLFLSPGKRILWTSTCNFEIPSFHKRHVWKAN